MAKINYGSKRTHRDNRIVGDPPADRDWIFEKLCWLRSCYPESASAVPDSILQEDAELIWFWAVKAELRDRDRRNGLRMPRELKRLERAAEGAVAGGQTISDKLYDSWSECSHSTVEFLFTIGERNRSEFLHPYSRIDAIQLLATITASRAHFSEASKLRHKDACAYVTFEAVLRATNGAAALIPDSPALIRGEPLSCAADLLKIVGHRFHLTPLATWARCARVSKEISPRRSQFAVR